MFIGSASNALVALDARTGQQLWAAPTGHAADAPPLAFGSVVGVGTERGDFIVVRQSDGREVWRYAGGGRIAGSAKAIRIGDCWHVLVGSYDAVLNCFEGGDGRRLWSFAAEGYLHATPAIGGQAAIVGSCDGRVYLVGLTNGALRAAVEAGSYVAASPAVEGGVAFVATHGGELLSIEVETGRVRWRLTDTNAGAFVSSPALGAERVVVGDRAGRVVAVKRETGEIAWSCPVRAAVDASPVIAGDTVWVGADDGRLRALRLRDGSVLWSYELGAGIAGSVAIVEGWLYVSDASGAVHGLVGRTPPTR